MNLQTVDIGSHTLQLHQDPGVWSPYSAVEMLTVLTTQGKLQNLENAHVLDFGTGSGIVGIFCGLMGAASVTLSDYCEKAVTIAEKNAKLNGLNHVKAIQGDRNDYDLIISNPPVQPWLYTDVIDQVHRSRVEAWNEAGSDGRLVLDSLLKDARNYLKRGGRLITSSSSRHGHRKTQHLLDTYWSGKWQEVYAAEHPILPAYHGPYLPSWQSMQVQDLDFRVYQKDQYDRCYAYQEVGEKSLLLIEQDQQVVRWQSIDNQWFAVDDQDQKISPQPQTAPNIDQLISDRDWLYQYYLLE
ncbi:MAG: hypothetical protein RLZZ435_1243, partial [Cyanobacteriota bacterium]